MNPQAPLTAAETGRLDALRRHRASSAHPDYQAGYLDGLHERAQPAPFRDRTVTGMVIEATPDAEGAAYRVLNDTGRLVAQGRATDVESAVATCEGHLIRMGHPTARLSQILASVERLHPELPTETKQRLATRAVEYMLEYRESRSR